jgi:hypothetical protein
MKGEYIPYNPPLEPEEIDGEDRNYDGHITRIVGPCVHSSELELEDVEIESFTLLWGAGAVTPPHIEIPVKWHPYQICANGCCIYYRCSLCNVAEFQSRAANCRARIVECRDSKKTKRKGSPRLSNGTAASR